MSKYAYVAYRVTVSKSGQPDDPLDVGNFDGKGADLVAYFHGFLRCIGEEFIRRQKYDQYLAVPELVPRGRRVEFVTEYGRYGLQGTLVDTISGEKTHSYDEDESPVVETRNMFVSPAEGRWAIFLAERYGGRGAASLILSEFKRAFRQCFENEELIVKYDGLLDPAAWAEYVEKADMTEMQVKRFGPSPDFADPVAAKSVGRVVSRVRPMRGQKGFGRAFRDKIISREIRAQDIIGIPVIDGDEVELKLNDGEQQRSVILGEEANPVLAYFLVGDKEERPSDGAVYAAMRKKVIDAKANLGLTLPQQWKDGTWDDSLLSVKLEPIRDS
ncbi:hypothetical protein ACGFMK_42440 [Amycolatopsis sp. NPDC049252]|uniref:hypothetical protein n=1 Tax=Amycolatopsis sp. NPDC049252 TaxID=3363933 RepID=UPI003710F0CA